MLAAFRHLTTKTLATTLCRTSSVVIPSRDMTHTTETPTKPEGGVEKLIIIGSGPAAHTAAIYAARASLNPLLFEGMMAGGVAPGGQLTTTTDVENFPGFPEGINGYDLMVKMREQSIRWGTRVETQTIEKVNFNVKPFEVFPEGASEPIKAHAVIVSTGATAKRLGIKGEETYWNKGISACAVCDGALPMFRNKPLVVIGGGDTAAEEATFLTHFASKVYLLVRRDVLRVSKAMQDRVRKDPKIQLVWNTEAIEALGEEKLTGVRVKDAKTGEERVIDANGLFYAIGHIPNTAFLNGQLKLDETGYVLTEPRSTATSIDGIFAAGDVQDKIYRQAITAAGTGCMAALEAERWLSHHESKL
jgi:thioredoxin reductase (NADPH)